LWNFFKYTACRLVNTYRGFEGSFKVKQASSPAGDEDTTILLTVGSYTGCPRRNVPDFGRVFLMLKYTDITQNTYVQRWTVTEIMATEV